MIQRIQTFYLTVSLILLGLMIGLPLGEIAVGDQIFSFSIQGINNEGSGEQLYNGLPLMVFLGIAIVVQLLAIFGFKNRVRQMRLSGYNILLMLGIVGVSFYFKYASFKEMEIVTNSYKLALVFPFIAGIFNYLGIRAIGRDEALVKSIDRIR